MKCKYHPLIPLEAQEVAFKDFSDGPNIQYRNVFYCPTCWEEHEKGSSIKHDIVHDDFLTKIQPEEIFNEEEISEFIELQVDERKGI